MTVPVPESPRSITPKAAVSALVHTAAPAMQWLADKSWPDTVSNQSKYNIVEGQLGMALRFYRAVAGENGADSESLAQFKSSLAPLAERYIHKNEFGFSPTQIETLKGMMKDAGIALPAGDEKVKGSTPLLSRAELDEVRRGESAVDPGPVTDNYVQARNRDKVIANVLKDLELQSLDAGGHITEVLRDLELTAPQMKQLLTGSPDGRVADMGVVTMLNDIQFRSTRDEALRQPGRSATKTDQIDAMIRATQSYRAQNANTNAAVSGSLVNLYQSFR